MGKVSLKELAVEFHSTARELAKIDGCQAYGKRLSTMAEEMTSPLLLMLMGEFSTGKSTFINAMITDSYRSQVPYSGWADGYKATISSKPTMIKVLDNNNSVARVAFELKARDKDGGRELVQIFKGECRMVKQGNQWKIDEIIAKKSAEGYD